MSLRPHAKAAPCCTSTGSVNSLAKVLAAGMKLGPTATTVHTPSTGTVFADSKDHGFKLIRVGVGVPPTKRADTRNDGAKSKEIEAHKRKLLLLELPLELKAIVFQWLRADGTYSELYKDVLHFCATSKKSCSDEFWRLVVEGVFKIDGTGSWKTIAMSKGKSHFEILKFIMDKKNSFDDISKRLTTCSRDTPNTAAYLEYCIAAHSRFAEEQLEVGLLGEDNNVLKFVPSDRADYAEVAKTMIQFGSYEFYGVDKNHADFADIFLSGVKLFPAILSFYDDSVIPDSLALDAVKINQLVFWYVGKDRTLYKEIALAAVDENPSLVVRELSENYYYRMDADGYREIIVKALKLSNPNDVILGYIPTEIDGFEEIAIEAVKRSPMAMRWLDSKEVTSLYFKVAMESVNHFQGRSLQYIDTSFGDFRKIALAAIEKNGEALVYLDKTFDGYFEIAEEAITKKPSLVTYAKPANELWLNKKVQNEWLTLQRIEAEAAEAAEAAAALQ
jgi:hypothetical protein